MTFARWPILFLLFIPLALIVQVWRDPRRRVTLPLDHGRQSTGTGWRILLDVIQSVAPLLLAIAILLLAGPRELSVPREKRVMTNVEFCLDVSGSMMTPFGVGSRHDAAVEAMNQFVSRREGDAFGLTLSSNIAVPWIPLTEDSSAFQCAAPFVRPENMWQALGGGTMLGVGLKKCADELVQRKEGDRMIILISDGASFDLAGGEEEQVGRELRDQGIVVYYVHIGGGVPPPPTAAVATITGGATFSAGDPKGLDQVFRRIDAMRSARLERTYADVLDCFRPFCLAGFILFGLQLLGLFGLRYTPW